MKNLDDLLLSLPKVKKILKDAGIDTIDKLAKKTKMDLSKLGIGIQSVNKISNIMSEIGLELKQEEWKVFVISGSININGRLKKISKANSTIDVYRRLRSSQRYNPKLLGYVSGFYDKNEALFLGKNYK